ncbi:MAG TPA: hypothetical protein VLB83_02365 [Candidatus Paceibacterota bacterium]|nr:hypothetical protein [Candidatus Paceibacterota bacterium]
MGVEAIGPVVAKGPWYPRTNVAGLRFVQDSIALLQSDRLSPEWSKKLQAAIDRVKRGELVLSKITDPWEYLVMSQPGPG